MSKKRRSSEPVGDKLVIHTPVLFEGKSVFSHILIPSRLIEMVTDEALAGIEGYEPDDTKAGTIEAWIGRFATNELHSEGLGLNGWSANHNVIVTGTDEVDSRRSLPFVLPGASKIGEFMVVKASIAPRYYKIEHDFTPRVISFLEKHGIITEST